MRDDRPRLDPRAAAWRAGIVATAILSGLHAPAGAQGGGRSAQLETLLTKLATRAAVYETTALRFACQEQVDVAEYTGKEAVKSQHVDEHDYLLAYSEEDGLQPYRAVLKRDGKSVSRKEVRPDYAVPEPYAWNLLFTTERQTRFQFELLESAVIEPSITWVLAFHPVLPYSDGNTIEQWEGRVWVDQDTLDVVQVEAEPANQAETMEARLAEYRQAFSFLGLKGKPRPRARRIQVEFGLEREGLRLPSRSLATTRLLAGDGRDRLSSSVVQRYSDYVFYGVESQEQFDKLRVPNP
jgi:hypothetical protein